MNYTRSQEVSRLQAEQKVQNCALLLAYVYGSPGGWYGIVKSSIDGFSSDYALISSNVGDWECHPAQVFCVTGDEDAREELEEIRQAVKESFEMDELPMVATLTEEEIQAAKQNVKEAFQDSEESDLAEWLEELCSKSSSDLSYCNWEAVAETVNE